MKSPISGSASWKTQHNMIYWPLSLSKRVIPHSEINEALKPNSNYNLFKLIARRVLGISLEMSLHSLELPGLSCRWQPRVPGPKPWLTQCVSEGGPLSFLNTDSSVWLHQFCLLVWEAKERLGMRFMSCEIQIKCGMEQNATSFHEGLNLL